MRFFGRVSTALTATLFAISCQSAPSGDPEDGVVVPEGKEDDFLTSAAAEFVIEGRSFVTVEEGEGEERAMELIQLKHIAISWFLNGLLVEEENDSGVKTGIGAMVKTGRAEEFDIVKLNARSYEFKFKQLVAGKKNLPQRLGVDADGEFTFTIGKPTNEEMARLEINNEWYRKDPWKNWKPETQPQSNKEQLTLRLSREQPTPDAWWDFQALIEDGLIDIDVHFGWDFHDNFHLKNSKKFYNWLIREKGFESPVDDWDDYDRNSGPLVRMIEADGFEVEVQIRIFYGHPGGATDPDTDAGGKLLEDDLRASLAEADIIAFEGHSGPFFGFPMANWKKTEEGDLDDAEMPFVDMPEKYQIVFGEGCDTFMIGPALLDNVNKNGQNIDIVTTISLSDGASTPMNNFVSRLLDLDSQGRHRPKTIRALLSELDPAAMYGVHGVEDNPRVHPYAHAENFCERCSSNGECGGAGNACIRLPDDGKRCAAACTSDDACGEGFVCKSVASESTSTIFAKMCVPRALSCE